MGLANTTLANEHDTLSVIADFLREAVDVPHAAGLSVLASEAHRIQITCVCEHFGEEGRACGSKQGLSYKSIIRHQKREKPVGFLCDQRYSWTKVLRSVEDPVSELKWAN